MKEKIIEFFNKGYRITLEGEIFNKSNNKMNGFVNKQSSRRNYKTRVFGMKFNKESYPMPYHKLQAYIKFGDKIFEKEIEVRHLDGNSLNNSFSNIGIGTHSENMMDINSNIRKSKASKASLKYNHQQILCDRNSGMSYQDIMIKHNISSKGTLSFIINKSISSNQI